MIIRIHLWQLYLGLAVVLMFGYVCIRYDEARIQATCEDDRGRTFINGTEYLCLSARQIQRLQMQARPGRSA